MGLAQAAEGLVGTRFRLHGRDPATGLDCIGLLEAALARLNRKVTLPGGYPLRLVGLDHWLPDPAECGFADAALPFEPGDVVLLRPATGQVHLAIAGTGSDWIHAHAGLRRVVSTPQIPTGPILHHWRLRPAS
ncbi:MULTISPECIES: hypothetical protein [unclassified Novosphingobium]|uniref:hypothetical protein n=1 Tax=unclassified Novosphingobium TaxID=2644732 RepID=UPI0025CE154A|nr:MULTISPECIES: hypothetical protein [unclassified Novosphingobium]HQV04232.1 hypothetical protein [Novosphingobium sp.]